MKHPGRAAATAGMAAALLAGCLGGGFQYVRHTSGTAAAYFKLPSRWRLFSQDDVLKARAGPLSPATLSQIRAESWSVAFDGSTSPGLGHVLALGAAAPAGVALVRTLAPGERDGYSLSSLRAELLPDDPLTAQSTTHSYDVLDLSDVKVPGGLHGVHMVVDLKDGAGVFRLNQVALLDADTQHVFVLGVGCSQQCYQSNAGTIDQIVRSWTVKER